jgi:membrane fusion protein (multidrug efflux system)
MKIHQLIKGILFSFLLISCSGKKDNKIADAKKQDAPAIVDVLLTTPTTITNNIEANGMVVANEYVELHPEANGRLTYLNVPEGSFIKQGTVIAKVYDADLQAQLSKSKVQLELAQKTEERLRKLLAINGVNQSDYDNALNAVNGYKADIQYTQSLIDKTVVKAPFNGLLGLKQISPGAYVTTATVIATLQQVDKVKIDFTVPEQYSTIIQKGNTVTVAIDAIKQKTLKATIIATEPQINQNSRNLKVRAVLSEGKINPGTFVKVTLAAGAAAKAIMIPTGCIIPDDKNKIIIVVKGGKANYTKVETGVRDAAFVEVTKGLNVGDSVVVTGVLFARPKAAVKVRSVKTLEQLSNQ